MFRHYRSIILLLSCLFCIEAYAQTTYTDSLQHVADRNLLPAGDKPALLNRLGELYRTMKLYDTAKARARQSAAIARQQHNYTEATAAYALLLNAEANVQEFAAMKVACDSAGIMAQRAAAPRARAYACFSKALFYKSFDSLEVMVHFCLQGLKELEQQADPYLASKLYYLLYAVNANWNKAEQADQYARKALTYALQTDNYNVQSNAYAALAVAHEYAYTASKLPAERDSILLYLRQAAQLYHQYPGRVVPHAYGIICINIADCYQRFFPANDKRARDSAIYYARIAGDLLRSAPNSEEIVASSLGILSAYAQQAGDHRLAERYLQEAYLLMQTGKPLYPTLITVTQSLADFYTQQGDYRRAMAFQKEVTTYSDKHFDQQQALNTQKLEVQYETAQKEREVQVLKEQEKSRRLQNYLYGGIAAASLLGLVFMFRAYHFRLRYSMQREKQLELEKQESEMQVRLEQEARARLKAEQQLLEARQQQLNTEAMANMLLLEHKNKMLHQLKDKLSDDEALHLQKMLKEEEVLDDDFEQAHLQIQQVHPGFFQQLGSRAQRKLTLLDLKLCAYLYLKMDTRHIARMMNIEIKSVRMSRYRIKQKLGLDKDEDLITFLQGLGEQR